MAVDREWRTASQAYDDVVRLSAELADRVEAGDPAALDQLCAAARHAGNALDRHRALVEALDARR